MLKRILSCFLIFVVMVSTFIFVGCGNSNSIIILTTGEEERIEFLSQKLDEKFPDYDITLQYVGTGELYSKLNEEKQSITGDIVYDFEVTNMEMLLASTPDLFYDLSSYDFSAYTDNAKAHTSRHTKYAVDVKQDGAIIVNKTVLSNAGVPVPETYEDLLNPIYKDLICMPNPNQSGTGYCFYSGMVAKLGEEKALEYFKEFGKNVVEYTSSGSAPIKRVNSGEVGIGICMLWQAVKYANENSALKVILLENTLPYTLYGMALINGRESRTEVKEVFDYLFNDLNKLCVEALNSEKLFVEQKPCSVPNYPSDFTEFDMPFLFDYEYKQKLLDKWGRN